MGISRVTIAMTHIRGLIAPLITTHEPPSRLWGFLGRYKWAPSPEMWVMIIAVLLISPIMTTQEPPIT